MRYSVSSLESPPIPFGSKITFSFPRTIEIRVLDKDPLMALKQRLDLEERCDGPRDGLEVSSLLCCLGSIALSPRSDLGLTPALEQLALVSSASVTISRKLSPTLA